ncbi:MAG TPA: hypothetical protein VIG64_04370 [Actinomycetota bacterium]
MASSMLPWRVTAFRANPEWTYGIAASVQLGAPSVSSLTQDTGDPTKPELPL